MKTSNGFTLIELMIVVVFIFTMIAILFPLLSGKQTHTESSYSYGINGRIETRCIEHVKIMIDGNGNAQPIGGPGSC